MARRKVRRYFWRRIHELKGPRPKTWKWERHQCMECNHITRYKVYRTWQVITPINYNTFLSRTIKSYAGALPAIFEAQRPMVAAMAKESESGQDTD